MVDSSTKRLSVAAENRQIRSSKEQNNEPCSVYICSVAAFDGLHLTFVSSHCQSGFGNRHIIVFRMAVLYLPEEKCQASSSVTVNCKMIFFFRLHFRHGLNNRHSSWTSK